MDNSLLDSLAAGFTVTVEVMPPKGPDPESLIGRLAGLEAHAFWGFSVATNPVARARMDALACCALIMERTGRPTVLHLTTRDHNRLSLQGLLWGAAALGIRTVLVATGDFVAMADRDAVSSVRDLDVLGLVSMAREAGLEVGVVLDPDPTRGGLEVAARRLEDKVAAGAQFVVTQPVYDVSAAQKIAGATVSLGVPVVLGILPVWTPRHARFLHEKVAGIQVPEVLMERMASSEDPASTGLENAREMLEEARTGFAGACLMPPFSRFAWVGEILPTTPDPVFQHEEEGSPT